MSFAFHGLNEGGARAAQQQRRAHVSCVPLARQTTAAGADPCALDQRGVGRSYTRARGLCKVSAHRTTAARGGYAATAESRVCAVRVALGVCAVRVALGVCAVRVALGVCAVRVVLGVRAVRVALGLRGVHVAVQTITLSRVAHQTPLMPLGSSSHHAGTNWLPWSS
jgi:hypothetical protein